MLASIFMSLIDIFKLPKQYVFYVQILDFYSQYRYFGKSKFCKFVMEYRPNIYISLNCYPIPFRSGYMHMWIKFYYIGSIEQKSRAHGVQRIARSSR